MPKIIVSRKPEKPVNVRQALDYCEVTYQAGKESGYLEFLCPFHNDKNFGSASMREYDGLWFCFSCGRGGNLTQFIAEARIISTQEAYRLLMSSFTLGEDDEEAWVEYIETFPTGEHDAFRYFENVALFIDKILTGTLPVVADSKKAAILAVCSWLKVPTITPDARFSEDVNNGVYADLLDLTLGSRSK